MPSKFTRRLGRRRALTGKRGNHNYYKGFGARSEGVHTNKGGFAIRAANVMVIRAPDLTNCQLKPYVAAKMPRQEDRVPDWVAIAGAAAAEKSPELR